MRKRRFMVAIFVGLLFTGTVSRTTPMAQEDEYNLAYTEVFGKLRRPQVGFSLRGAAAYLPAAEAGQHRDLGPDRSLDALRRY